jgi:large subunit ribosomal protein L18
MKTKTQLKKARRVSRHNRIRSRVIGSAAKPRLAVFKSNTGLYAQLIDDEASKTIAASDTRKQKGNNLGEKATALGADIASQAKAKGIEAVVFDRGGFRYQGAVAALADAAREAGLKF